MAAVLKFGLGLLVCLLCAGSIRADGQEAVAAASPQGKMEESVARLKSDLKLQLSDRVNSVSTSLQGASSEESSPLSSSGRMLKALGICLGVFFIIIALVKKVGKPQLRQGGRIKVLETISLGSKSTVALLEIEGRKVLVSYGSEPAQLLRGALPLEGLGGEEMELLCAGDREKI